MRFIVKPHKHGVGRKNEVEHTSMEKHVSVGAYQGQQEENCKNQRPVMAVVVGTYR